MPEFEIAGRPVGDTYAPLVVAEIGINHGGSVQVAIDMVSAAADAGAEVVKLQTHVMADEMSQEAKQRIPGNADISIFEIMDACALSVQDESRVFEYARSLGLIIISTPFSRSAVDRLVNLEVPAIKIGSGECSNYPLVERIAGVGVPVLMSTGMHTIADVTPSVEILRAANVPFALLHTTNLYPTPVELVRLNAMVELREAFPDAVIGLSDHTLTNYPCLGAVALGASILERHFTDSLERPGPDISCSMDPRALSDLIEGSRLIHRARGGGKGPVPEEQVTRDFALASVVAVKDIAAGELLTEDNIWVMRPAGGDFGPAQFPELLGKRAVVDVAAGWQLPAAAVEG